MKAVALLLSLFLMSPHLAAKPPAGLQERLDEWIKGQPGGVALAWVDAEGAAFFQSGRCDGPDSPPVTPDTQFELGSVTKGFTALLLAESERAGKVGRNDPAAKFLLPPADPDHAALDKITLLTLATHTSGLPRLSSNIGPSPDANPDPYAAYDRTMLVEALRKDGAKAPVGRGVAYSNFGAAVLGEALGSAWDTSYAEALRVQVLAPLGMKATTVGLAGEKPPPDFPPGHVGGKVVPNWTFQAYAPAGALRSSARDMAIFLAAALEKGSGPLHAAFAATVQPQRALEEVGGKVGLGWFITDEGVIWHNGATAGSHAFVAFSPKAAAGIAILANVQLPSEPLGFSLLGTRPPQPKIEVALRGKLSPPSKEVALSAETLREYVGDYPLAPQFVLTITEAGGTLFAQATGQGKAPLFASAKDEFFYKIVNAQISFQRDAEGRVVGLVLHQNGRDLPAPKKQ